MNEKPELETLRKFRERVERNEFTDSLRAIYRVAGGMPHQRLDEEVRLSAGGAVQVNDHVAGLSAQAELDATETRNLFHMLALKLDSLATRSEARFLPDSLVGVIIIEVDGEEAWFFFSPERSGGQQHESPLAPMMAQALENFSAIIRRLLRKGEI